MSKQNNKQVKKIINNKTVHIELPGEVHKRLRAQLFVNEISMQQFFKLMSEKVVENDQYILQLIEDRVDLLKENKLNKLREINPKDLYNVIEKNSPLS
jgi:predicted outer membrane protein